MAPTRRTGLHYYDGKAIWEKYMSMGKAATYKKILFWCNETGMVNPATGKASFMGPRFAMWRYAIRNPEEAYKPYFEWQREYGNFPTFKEFCEDLSDHAYTKKTAIVSPKEKEEFIEKYLSETGEQ